MKIKLFAIVTFLLLYAAQSKAQQNEYADKVYFNNGSLIVCKIVYYQPNDTLKVQMESGQMAHFYPHQIKKIVMYEATKGKVSRAEKAYNFKERGTYDAFSIGLNFGQLSQSSRRLMGLDIQNVVGFQFNRWAGGGIGMGLNSYYFLYGASNVLSIFGEYRGYLGKRNTSEYWTFAAGFGQPLKNKTENLTNLKGGFMIQPTVGWRFGASRRYNFFADLGFRLQQVQYESNNTWSENHYKVTYRRWILRGGILF